MLSDSLWIVAGFVALIGGAELLVRGSVWFALQLGLSKLMVGLTLVAFGTSAPELVVSLQAALEDRSGYATGTVLGSNAANIGLIVGCAALVSPIRMVPGSVRFELAYTILAGVLTMVPLVFALGGIDRNFGLLLVAFVVLFTFLLIRQQRAERAKRRAQPVADRPEPPPRSAAVVVLQVVFVLVGFAGLIYGGEWLVGGASGIASRFGLSDALIGNTIIAVGTSAPELATALIAARRGHSEIALGNVLGSNVFNVGMVLGTTAVIHPIPYGWESEGLAASVGLGMALFLAFALRGKGVIDRLEASILLLAYLGFMVAAAVRG